MIGLAALICYYIGLYLLLFLSRTREYLADGFSAEQSRAEASGERPGEDRLWHRHDRRHRGHAKPAPQLAPSRRDRCQQCESAALIGESAKESRRLGR